METKTAQQPIDDKALGLLLGLIGVLIFSGTLPATRIAVGSFDPWFVTFARASMATMAAGITLGLLKRRFPRRHAPVLFLIGILLVFGFPGFMAVAMVTVPSSHGGVILGILPLATAVFAALLADERPSPAFWLYGIAGSLLIVIFALRAGDWGFVVGDFWLFAAGLCAAIGYVLSGKLSHVMPGWEVISWALLLTAPLSVAATWYLWDRPLFDAPTAHLIAFVYLGLGSMYLGFFAWNTGLKLGGLAKVGQLQLFQTFFTIAIAALVLGEPVSGETWLWALAIVAAVWLGQRSKVATR